MRDAEDQMEVAHREQFPLSGPEPFLASVGLALRTVAISAGVVGDGLITTVIALIAMSAQRGGTTPRDGVEHLDLCPGQRCAIAFNESGSCLADYVGHLP